MQWNNTGLVIIAALAVSSCGKPPPQPDGPRPVKSIIAVSESPELIRTFPGRISAFEQVDLSFEVSGKLKELPIKRGDKLAADQLVAKLDETDFVLAVNRATAGVSAAKAVVVETETSLNRLSGLREQDAVSQQDVDRAQAAYDQATATYDNASALLEQAQENLADTQLMAPYDGIVADRYFDNFAQVTANQAIVTLQNLDILQVTVDVPESFVLSVEKREQDPRGSIAKVRFLTEDAQHFDAHFVEFTTEPDPQTKTYGMIYQMATPPELVVLPGMSAEVTVTGFGRSFTGTGVRVPLAAVTNAEAGQGIVWVVGDDQQVAQRAVSLGEIRGHTVRILDGLTVGERVVTAGVSAMTDGLVVRLLDSDQP